MSNIYSIVSSKPIPFTVPPKPPSPRLFGKSSMLLEPSLTPDTGSMPSSPFGSQHSLNSLHYEGSNQNISGIDPSLYKQVDEDDSYDFGPGHLGRIWFSVEYEPEHEKLVITVEKVHNLPSRVSGACDSFARICILPDERRYLQSKCKKKTCNPRYEENFMFLISNKTIEDRTIKITIYEVDRLKHNKIIGHALYSLQNQNLGSTEKITVWRDLETEISETKTDIGEINISLAYNDNLERLTCGIFSVKGLKIDNSNSTADFYTKVCLMQQNRLVKSKKSEIAKKTSSPKFNESFTFKMTPNSLDTASLIVSLSQHSSGYRDKTIGRVVFGSFMFSRGKELEHWNQMISHKREQVTEWHSLT